MVLASIIFIVCWSFILLCAWYDSRVASRKKNLEADVFEKYVPGTYTDIYTIDDMGEYIACDKKIAKITFHDKILTVRMKDDSGKTISSQFQMERRNVKTKHLNIKESGEFFANVYQMSNLDSGIKYDVVLYRYFEDIWRGNNPDMISLAIKDPFDEGKVSCIFYATRKEPKVEEVEY